MRKTYKLLPCSLYDIPGVEQWLEEQANHGLFPTHLGSYASFSKDGVPGTRYRLEPWGKLGTEPTPKQLELYRSAGWEYAFSVARVYYLFYTADGEAPELYSDFATRGQSLDRLAARLKRARIGRFIVPAMLMLALLATLLWPTSQFDLQPDRWARVPMLLLHFTDPLLLLCLILFCFYSFFQQRDYRALLSTYRCLQTGLPPRPSPGAKKSIMVKNAVQLILVPLLALFLLLNFPAAPDVPLSKIDLPYVSLADLESEPVSTYDDLFGEDNHPFTDENQARSRFSLLAPRWYEVSQSLYSPQAGTRPGSYSPNPEDRKSRYAPSLDMTRFSLLTSALCRPVAQAQLDVYRLVNLYWTYQDIDYPGTDFVIVAQAEGGCWQMAALGYGNKLAVFRYSGQEQLVDHLDVLAQIVSR